MTKQWRQGWESIPLKEVNVRYFLKGKLLILWSKIGTDWCSDWGEEGHYCTEVQEGVEWSFVAE